MAIKQENWEYRELVKTEELKGKFHMDIRWNKQACIVISKDQFGWTWEGGGVKGYPLLFLPPPSIQNNHKCHIMEVITSCYAFSACASEFPSFVDLLSKLYYA